MALNKHIFSVNVDFSQRELLNAVLQNLFQAPLVPIEGQVYYDSFYNVPYYWNDNEWIPWERPIHKKYTSEAEMIADQQYQLKQFIYYDGSVYWEYLGTTNGDITDYNIFSSPQYVHPTYTPYNLTLTGATVIQDIETDSIGSVVNLTVRELNLSDLGYSGSTNADFYSNWVLNINDTEFYVVESENILNINAGDNVTLDTSGNTLTISSQDTIYIHPSYTDFDITFTGSTVISRIVTDNIGSVVNIETRTLTPEDIGAEPAFLKGDIIIPPNSGLSVTGNTTERLVGDGDIIFENDDKGSDQNIFKEIRDISGTTAISATTNNDFIQIEGRNGTEVTFESGNKVVIESSEQDNIVRVLEIPQSEIDFDQPIATQIVTYINNLQTPYEITETDSKLNILIKKTNFNVVCGATTLFSGGQSYPQTDTVFMGEDTGEVTLNYNAYTVPDRFIVKYNDFILIDTGYRGSSAYDFGGANRQTFINSLSGLTDPVLGTTYPDLVNFTDDGYPRILGSGLGSLSYTKYNTDPLITIEVYGPISGTAWEYNITCPDGVTPTPDECDIIFELINNGKGLYGLNENTITESDLLLISDRCNVCCDAFVQDNFVRVLNIPCDSINFSFPVKPQIASYINQLDPPLIINDTDSKYNVVIECDEPGVPESCDNGVDILFVLDYTDSMGNVIEEIKNDLLSPSGFTNSIINNSGGDYRIGCVLVDEYTKTIDDDNPNYSGSTFYQELLNDGKVYINIGENNRKQFITNIVDFSDQNVNEFITNINKIYITDDQDPDYFPLGGGASAPEPYDLAIDICVNGIPFTGTTRTDFITPFRENVSKQIIVITDNPPSSNQDLYNQITINFINTSLRDTISNNNIKLSILAERNILPTTPVNNNYGVYLDGFVFDGLNRKFLLNNPLFSNVVILTINDDILSPTNYIIEYDNNTITIKDTVSLNINDNIKIKYYANILLNIVEESTGIFSRDYSPNGIKNLIDDSCQGETTEVIYEITGYGFGDTEIDSCLAYDANSKLYTFCETIQVGCNLYYDDFGNLPVIGINYVSIDNTVYGLDPNGKIISVSSLNCNDIIETTLFIYSGYGNTSNEACDDANTNNRTLYSDCSLITTGCTIYIDTYGLNPLTGFTNVFIDDQVWDINSTTGVLESVSSTQCSTQQIITFNNTGYGNTVSEACDDSNLNNRTLYSDCPVIVSGCTVYIDDLGNTPLTGFTNVFIDDQVWDINSTTGVIDSLSSIQCPTPVYYSFTNSGRGNSVNDACNDATFNNRTFYSDCQTLSAGCFIYTDSNGSNLLTGYIYVVLNGTVWNISNSTGELISISTIQCQSSSVQQFDNCGYGNTSIEACNDATSFSRTLYSDCIIIDVGCTVFTDINGSIPLTGFDFVFIDSIVWNINSTNGEITSQSPTQC